MRLVLALAAVSLPSVALACGPRVEAWRSGVPYADLQSALDDLVEGDEVLVCPGVHVGPFVASHPPSFALRGATGDPADVVLTGLGVDHILVVDTDNDLRLTIEHLTFADGWSTDHAAALEVRPDFERLLLRDLVFTGNDGSSAAVVSTIKGDIQVEDCDFADNGGGDAALSASARRTTIADSVFRNNHTAYGLKATGRWELTVTGSVFERNARTGASLHTTYEATQPIRLEDSVFRLNGADRPFVGGLELDATAEEHGAIIERTLFDGNKAMQHGSAAAIEWHGPGPFVLRDSAVLRNGAFGNLENCSVAAVESEATSVNGPILIEGSRIEHNTVLALAVEAGGTNPQTAIIRDSRIAANQAAGISVSPVTTIHPFVHVYRLELDDVSFGVGRLDNVFSRLDYADLSYCYELLGDHETRIHDPGAGLFCAVP